MRALAAKLLVALISFGICGLVAELVLRVAGLGEPPERTVFVARQQIEDPLPGVRYLFPARASFEQQYPSDPRGYFHGEGHKVRYELNNFGFRDNDFQVERGERLRVAFLGDSFCWGAGVHREDTLEARLEASLNAGRLMGMDWEVYSFCLPGFNTASEVALYDQVVRHFQPDALVVWYVLNDVNLPPDLFLDWKVTQQGQLGGRVRRRSRLAEFAFSTLEGRLDHHLLLSGTEAAYRPEAPGRRSVEESFGLLAEQAGSDGVPVLVAIFPWLYGLESSERYPFGEAHRVVASLAEDRGFDVVDLLDAFIGTESSALWVHPSDRHPNEQALERAASAVVEPLERLLMDPRHELVKRRRALSAEAPPSIGVAPWW